MALILDGKICRLDEMAEEVVYDRWDASMLEAMGMPNMDAILAASRKAKKFAKS